MNFGRQFGKNVLMYPTGHPFKPGEMPDSLAEAKMLQSAVGGRNTAPERRVRQLRLPGTKTRLKLPHEKSVEEFAASPRTMFHGTPQEQLPRDPFDFSGMLEGSTNHRLAQQRAGIWARKGFHVGTQQAATQRVDERSPDRTGGYLHPVQITTPMKNLKTNPIADQDDDWSPKHHQHYYRNEYEDKGSISAVLRSSTSVTSYRQFVEQADAAGKPIAGAAREALMQSKQTGVDPHLPSYQKRRQQAASQPAPPFDHQPSMILTKPYSTDVKPMVNPDALPPMQYRQFKGDE